MFETMIYLAIGFILLVAGGELLVRGAVRIAERLGLSPLLIGLTVVGLGTSMPELAASLQASLSGSPGLALGNIVGSNMANLLLILGFAAIFAPMAVPKSVLWRDGGVGVAAVLALILAGYTVGLGRGVGGVFLLALFAYIFHAYRSENRQKKQALAEATANQAEPKIEHGAAYDRAIAKQTLNPALTPHTKPQGSIYVAIGLFLVGMVLIIGGGRLLVDAAIEIAASFGVSDEVIGLTIVAIGTSMPELVTSAIAAYKKQSDIALGNVLGSNIYNVLFIGGVTGIVAPADIPESILRLDLWLALGAALVVMLFAYTGGRLNRKEGTILLATYITYTLFTAGIIGF